jgi:hypothetical protein
LPQPTPIGSSFTSAQPIVLLCVFSPTLFVTYFVHNVSATVSYGKKSFWISGQRLITSDGTKIFVFKQQDAQDIL